MKKVSIIKIILILFVLLAAAEANEPNAVSVNKTAIGGTGDSQELLRALAGAFEAKNSDCKIEVPDSIGSSGGIKALLRGDTNMARVARELKDEEKAQGLTYQLFAKSPIVFVVNPSIADINGITTEQIIGIYSGKITYWKQLGGGESKIYPITREPTDSSLQVLNKLLTGFEDTNSTVAKMIYTTPEAVKTLTEHKGTIGFVPLSMTIGTDLRILKIDGVYPSVENVSDGKYKFVTPFGIVYKGELRGLEKSFIEFLYSQDGREIITEMGTVPAK